MVRIRIREIAEKKGISNPFQLMKATGLNYAQCHLYWRDDPRQIGVDAINRICMALRVTPGQLFEFEPDPGWTADAETKAKVRRSKSEDKRKARRS